MFLIVLQQVFYNRNVFRLTIYNDIQLVIYIIAALGVSHGDLYSVAAFDKGHIGVILLKPSFIASSSTRIARRRKKVCAFIPVMRFYDSFNFRASLGGYSICYVVCFHNYIVLLIIGARSGVDPDMTHGTG